MRLNYVTLGTNDMAAADAYWFIGESSPERLARLKSELRRTGETLSDEAKKQDADGVICGHIHQAASKMFGDTHYINIGDWVESCTAVVEDQSGNFELIRWLEVAGAETAQAVSGQEVGVAV